VGGGEWKDRRDVSHPKSSSALNSAVLRFNYGESLRGRLFRYVLLVLLYPIFSMFRLNSI